ncbi:MAG: glycosyltransferase [Sedimentisphaerales bacterium]|nr:glycosyltransferase [Sedimentisphaerales bacterium]
MKIAFVVSAFPKLSETFIVNQITGLLEMGHDVRIFATRDDKDKNILADVIKYKLPNRTCYPPPKPKLRIFRILKSLGLLTCLFFQHPRITLSAMKFFLSNRNQSLLDFLQWIIPFIRHNFDIIHSHFGPNGLRCLCLKNIALRAKLINTFHGYDVTTYVREKGSDVYQELFRHADLFTYNSQATREKLLKLNCPDEKLEKVQMGVNVDLINFNEKTLTPGDTINILSVGRLIEMKGREYAIKAVARIAPQFPNINYQIVGNGPEYEPLLNLIEKLHMQEKIKLLGWVSSENLDSLYNSSHIFLHPSVVASDGNMEGQGVVLQEAQAAGLPVLATNHNAFPDSIIDGQSGFLVPERDVDALAEKLTWLCQNYDKWPEMGKTGRKFVEQTFDIKKLNQKLETIYFNLLQQ